MTMYIIDTDILIAEILSKYLQDDTARKVLSFYRKIPLMKRVIPDFIMNEFEQFMTNVIPVRYALEINEKKQLQEIITAYLRQINSNCTLVSPNQQIMKNAFSLYQQYKNDSISNHISLTDCLLLATAVQLQYTIVSLDTAVNAYAEELRIPRIQIKD